MLAIARFRRIASILAIFCLVIAAGCEDDDDDDAPPPPPPPPPFTSDQLVAGAGDDQEFAVGASTRNLSAAHPRSFFRVTETSTRAPSATAWAVASVPPGATP